MDIERLVEEQKKTQEAIRLLRESDSLENLFSRVPEAKLGPFDDPFASVDAWDYQRASETCDFIAAHHISKAVEHLEKAKSCLSRVERFYDGLIKSWEEERQRCLKLSSSRQKGAWRQAYANPVCRKFFEDYERANGIKNSIYKEAKGE